MNETILNAKARLTLRRSLLLAALGASASGCMGSFALSRSLYDWNGKLGSKWVNGAVFIALLFVAVYPLVMFIDAFILNALEFWFDKKLITANGVDHNGNRVASKRIEDNLVRHEISKDGELLQAFHSRLNEDGSLELLDDQLALIASVHHDGDGAVARDASGRLVARLAPEQVAHVRDAMRSGSGPSEGVLAMNEVVHHNAEMGEWARAGQPSSSF